MISGLPHSPEPERLTLAVCGSLAALFIVVARPAPGDPGAVGCVRSSIAVLDTARELRMSGRLREALATIDGSLSEGLAPCLEVRLRLQRAVVLDRIGLHTQTRPVAEALREIEKTEAIAAQRDLPLGMRAEVALARAYYRYREEMPEREFPRADRAVGQAIRWAREARRLSRIATASWQGGAGPRSFAAGRGPWGAGETEILADAVHQLGLIRTFQRDTVAARELFEASLVLDREAGGRDWMLGEYHRHVALTYVFEDDWSSALPHYVESHKARLRVEALDPSLFSALSLGDALTQTGSPDEAIPYFEYARDVAIRIGSEYALALASVRIAERLEAKEELEEARRFFAEARDAAKSVERDSLVERARGGLERLEDHGRPSDPPPTVTEDPASKH